MEQVRLNDDRAQERPNATSLAEHPEGQEGIDKREELKRAEQGDEITITMNGITLKGVVQHKEDNLLRIVLAGNKKSTLNGGQLDIQYESTLEEAELEARDFEREKPNHIHYRFVTGGDENEKLRFFREIQNVSILKPEQRN